MRLRTLVQLVLVTVVLASAAPSVKALVSADTASIGPGSCSGNASGDYDGNDADDLAIGVPGENLSGKSNAGAVNVIYGSSASTGLVAADGVPHNQFWHENVEDVPDKVEPRDAFGRCVTAGDFNGDGADDLAIGVPREGVKGRGDAGVVIVLYGAHDVGLQTEDPPAQIFNQTQAGGKVEGGDEFGSALTAGNFDGDDPATDDLAIGAPLEDQSGDNSGAVSVLYGGAAGLTSEGVDYFTQDSTGVANNAQADEKFGSALAAGLVNDDDIGDLAIGVAEENVDGAADAGAVHVLYGLAGGLDPAADDADETDDFWTQDSSFVDDTAESGDNFGWSVAFGDFNADGSDDLAVGAPKENVGGDRAAGAVNVILGSTTGLDAEGDEFLTQDNIGSDDPNDSEPADFFGASLVASEFEPPGADEDLAVGVPGEAVGGADEAGAVEIVYGDNTATFESVSQFLTQNSPDVEETSEVRDHFGLSVTAGEYNQDNHADLAIGAPGENERGGKRGEGAVHVIYSEPSTGGLDPAGKVNDQFWTQDSPDILDRSETNDLFGRSLA